MTTLHDELPADQRELLIYRLGREKLKQIETTIEDGEIKMPEMAGGDQVRGRPRMSYPINRFYQACLREIGPYKSKKTIRNEPPTPANAWLEVIRAMDQGVLIEPTFSHPHISDTIAYFHGWPAMWTEFNKVQKQTARGRFIMGYRDIVGGTIK